MSTIVNLNLMAGTKVDSFLQSVQLTESVDNGSFVVLGGVLANNPDVRVATKPTAVTTQEVLLVASPELVEVNGYRIDLSDPTLFTNPANKPARAFHLKKGDTFTITDVGLDGVSVVGQYVIPQDGSYKGIATSKLDATTCVAFLVLEKTNISVGRTRIPATKLQVVKEA
ncbi:hypothetical protein NV379_02605 [Paenibacillus sp. N1-5-1-14]|uniref:hypothetical protein n=1 Tax=Paenibacillus radicibacter TaxID=2972488 RepID=UPI002158B680|nr:hypothetical protein [Paenibacillus radicibacter]MCR8641537.1 hypothetical protein [Paenibacillus radicibacter]